MGTKITKAGAAKFAAFKALPPAEQKKARAAMGISPIAAPKDVAPAKPEKAVKPAPPIVAPTFTDKEQKVLRALRTNFYGDAGETETWANCINEAHEPSGVEGKALGAIVASLRAKGAVTCGSEGKDAWTCLTDAGRAAADALAPIATPKAPNAPKTKPGVITNVNSTRSGPPHVVVVAGDRKVMIPTERMSGELQKIAVVGGLLSAVQAYLDAHKPIAKLARGVDGHVAPNAVAAAAAQRKAPAAPKPQAVAPSPAKAKAPKAPRAAASRKPAPAKAGGDAAKITILDKAYSYGAPNTARNAAWLACARSATVGAYMQAGGKAKYLPRWVAAGAIKVG